MRTACTERRLLAALLARLLGQGLVGLPPAAAQTSTSGAADAGVLREAKAAADTSACAVSGSCHFGTCDGDGPCPLDSWTADTEPCGDGYNDYGYDSIDRGYDDLNSGWVGVLCDARGGRVVHVNLSETGVGGELLPFFGRLGALRSLWLSGNPALRGGVADLAGATELRSLGLGGCPLVVGEAAALAALVHLGEAYTTPCSAGSYRCVDGQYTGSGTLSLAGSGVHGPAAALRALPGLGADWGPEHSGPSWVAGSDFTPCSAFGNATQPSDDNGYTWGTGSPGCATAGLAPVAVRPPTPLFPVFSGSCPRCGRALGG